MARCARHRSTNTRGERLAIERRADRAHRARPENNAGLAGDHDGARRRWPPAIADDELAHQLAIERVHRRARELDDADAPASGRIGCSGSSLMSSMLILPVAAPRDDLAKHGGRKASRRQRETQPQRVARILMVELAHADAQRTPLRFHAFGVDDGQRFRELRGRRPPRAPAPRPSQAMRPARRAARWDARRARRTAARARRPTLSTANTLPRPSRFATSPGRQAIPGPARHALGQDGVEDHAARRRQHEARVVAAAPSRRAAALPRAAAPRAAPARGCPPRARNAARRNS